MSDRATTRLSQHNPSVVYRCDEGVKWFEVGPFATTDGDAAQALSAVIKALRDAPSPVTERVRNDDDGSLDEVVTAGPAHLERIDRRRWFLALYRADGSSLAVWLHGDVVLTEERGSL